MGKLYEMKAYLVKFYGKYSAFIDKALKFVLAFLTFTYISRNIGFLEIAANPVMNAVLSVICMLLPVNVTIILASVAILVQILTVSAGMAIIALIVFLVIYVFYFRFSSRNAVIMVLVPVAFMLRIPVVVPIVFGLIAGPACILPITAGTVIYYVVEYAKANASVFETNGDANLLGQIMTYSREMLTNREMWCVIIAFAVTLLIVYGVRRMSVDHSWDIAIVAGALGNVNVMAYGYIIMDIQISYISLIVESVIAVAVAFIVKMFTFSVDYTGTRYLQFDDDEYYYYVKAVPKTSVDVPKRTVKRIHARQMTGAIDAERVRRLEEEKNREEV